MLDIVLDATTIGMISTFETVTGATVKDCIDLPDKVVFVINAGQIGQAVGKSGRNTEQLRGIFRKSVQVIEYSEIPEQFVRNVFRNCDVQKVGIEQRGAVTHATVTVNPQFKAKAIGREGKNLKLARDIISRHHNIGSVSVA